MTIPMMNKNKEVKRITGSKRNSEVEIYYLKLWNLVRIPTMEAILRLE